MSPGLFSPPVESLSTSHAFQPLPSKASHTRGGFSGLTPTPSIRQLKRRLTTLEGTASGSPIKSDSPGTGGSEKAAKAWRESTEVRSVSCPEAETVDAEATVEGIICRSSVVSKTIGRFEELWRGVEVRVPRGIVMMSAWGAESQKVTSEVAALGGNSCTPSKSRNFR